MNLSIYSLKTSLYSIDECIGQGLCWIMAPTFVLLKQKIKLTLLIIKWAVSETACSITLRNERTLEFARGLHVSYVYDVLLNEI